MSFCINVTNPFIHFIEVVFHQISFICKNSNAKQKFIDGLLGCSLEYCRPHTTTKYAVLIHRNGDNRYKIQIDDGHQETFESHDNFVQYIKTNRDKSISKMTLFLPQLKYEILDKVVLHDAQCFNYSDQLNEVIIGGCYNSCTLVVLMSAIGGIGYQEEIFLSQLIAKCPYIFKVILVFTDMDRVPKIEKVKNQAYHTNSINRLMAIYPNLVEQWKIIFIGTNKDHLDEIKLNIWNTVFSKDNMQSVSHYTRLVQTSIWQMMWPLKQVPQIHHRKSVHFTLMTSNDIEYVIKKYFPRSSRFSKHCLMLLVRFVICMIRWNGRLDVTQLRLDRRPSDITEIYNTYKTFCDNHGLFEEYKSYHWRSSLCKMFPSQEFICSPLQYDLSRVGTYYTEVFTIRHRGQFSHNYKYLIVRHIPLLLLADQLDESNTWIYDAMTCRHLFNVYNLLDLGRIRSNIEYCRLTGKFRDLLELLHNRIGYLVRSRNTMEEDILKEKSLTDKYQMYADQSISQIRKINFEDWIKTKIKQFNGTCHKGTARTMVEETFSSINGHIDKLFKESVCNIQKMINFKWRTFGELKTSDVDLNIFYCYEWGDKTKKVKDQCNKFIMENHHQTIVRFHKHEISRCEQSIVNHSRKKINAVNKRKENLDRSIEFMESWSKEIQIIVEEIQLQMIR